MIFYSNKTLFLSERQNPNDPTNVPNIQLNDDILSESDFCFRNRNKKNIAKFSHFGPKPSHSIFITKHNYVSCHY